MATWYLEIDNNWDSEKEAPTAAEAVKALYPKALDIDWSECHDDNGYDVSVYRVRQPNGNVNYVSTSKKEN